EGQLITREESGNCKSKAAIPRRAPDQPGPRMTTGISFRRSWEKPAERPDSSPLAFRETRVCCLASRLLGRRVEVLEDLLLDPPPQVDQQRHVVALLHLDLAQGRDQVVDGRQLAHPANDLLDL